MTEIDPNLKGENQGIGAEILEQMPDWNEHKEKLEEEKSKEQRQVDDLEVLFSFCDEKDVLEILRSDDYGVLLDNNVSLVDLFNANALFDEQYYGDGYSKDAWRYINPDDPYSGDSEDKLSNKQEKRNSEIEDHYRFIEQMRQRAWHSGRPETAEYFSEIEDDASERGLDNGDKERAQDAKETIAIIANTYLSKDAPTEETEQFKEILSLRANGEDISDEQKEFLERDFSRVTDRLLYEGHVINDKRAKIVDETIDDIMRRDGEEDSMNTAARGLDYIMDVVEEFRHYGRYDLIKAAHYHLCDIADYDFDYVMEADDSDGGFRGKRKMILRYVSPYDLIDRAKKYNLVGKNGGRQYIEPNEIVEKIVNAVPDLPGSYLMSYAEDLKNLGADDDVILDNMRALRTSDFDESWGNKLIDVGIDKKKIAKKLFIDSPYIFMIDQTEGDRNPYKMPRSDVEVLEDAGFTMTDIAKASTPDVISKNLKNFLEEGADAKELVKHMMSYREKFEKNIISRDDDGSLVSSKVWFNGMQPMVVWDENHPEGRIINKFGMHGDGKDFVFANLDVLAENGVTEEDILEEMSLGDCYPFRKYVPRLLEQPQFDKQKVMDLAYKKYVERLKWEKEKGWCDDEAFEREADPQYYYTKIIEQLTEEKRKERDEYFKKFLEDKK